MDNIDNLLRNHANTLQVIYDQRIAGNHTFLGVLTTYTRELDALRAAENVPQVGDRVVITAAPFGDEAVGRHGEVIEVNTGGYGGEDRAFDKCMHLVRAAGEDGLYDEWLCQVRYLTAAERAR